MFYKLAALKEDFASLVFTFVCMAAPIPSLFVSFSPPTLLCQRKKRKVSTIAPNDQTKK